MAEAGWSEDCPLSEEEFAELRAKVTPPPISNEAAWIFERYLELDRSEMGGITSRGMSDLLDELGVTDPEERSRQRRLWRGTNAAEREQRKKYEKPLPTVGG